MEESMQYVSHTLDFSECTKNTSIVYRPYQTDKAVYTIMNCDTSLLNDSDMIARKYRSVIMENGPNSKLLCYTPPKSISYELFVKLNSEITDDLLITDIVEGTMVTLFYDDRIQSWEIATKSAVGGDYFFYRTEYNNAENKQPSFRSMFMDALKTDRTANLNDVVIFENLPKNYSYSFVLQHPNNHFVLDIQFPELYLVAVYDINEAHATNIPLSVFREWSCFKYIEGIINFPLQYTITPSTSYTKLLTAYTSIQNDYQQMGIMITNLATGHRCSIRNPTYITVHTLRGNNPNLLYHYLCLRRMNKLDEFIKYFPRYKKQFYQFYQQYMDFVKNVHQSYLSYYVNRSTDTISPQYMQHIHKLHYSIYIPSLMESKQIITKYVVMQYVNTLSPGKILFDLYFQNPKA